MNKLFPLVFFLSGILTILLTGCAAGKLEMQFNGPRTIVSRDGKTLDFRDCLREQLHRHPSMQAEDVLKLCFQSAYGAAHLLHDPVQAKKYFDREFNAVSPCPDEPLFEIISPDFVRVNIRAWKAAGFPAEWLFNMVTTPVKFADSDEVFQKYLAIAREELSGTNRQRFIELSAGCSAAPHHSVSYRDAEKPSYRVVNIRFINTFPVLQKIISLPDKEAKIIAIDGRAASGKTTLARQLAIILDTDVVHMDDFFLPTQLRTPERYREPGGNVHYERFKTEVLPQLNSAQPFKYRKFDCSTLKIGAAVPVRGSMWRIVEGAYSMHPEFGDYADLKIFYDVDPQEQMRRIILRNGEQRAKMFQQRWIPLEEAYIRSFNPARRADLVIGN